MCELLEEGEHEQEVVDGALAFKICWPFSQALWQLFGAALESEYPLIHALNLSYYIYPQQAAIACDCCDDICV